MAKQFITLVPARHASATPVLHEFFYNYAKEKEKQNPLVIEQIEWFPSLHAVKRVAKKAFLAGVLQGGKDSFLMED